MNADTPRDRRGCAAAAHHRLRPVAAARAQLALAMLRRPGVDHGRHRRRRDDGPGRPASPRCRPAAPSARRSGRGRDYPQRSRPPGDRLNGGRAEHPGQLLDPARPWPARSGGASWPNATCATGRTAGPGSNRSGAAAPLTPAPAPVSWRDPVGSRTVPSMTGGPAGRSARGGVRPRRLRPPARGPGCARCAARVPAPRRLAPAGGGSAPGSGGSSSSNPATSVTRPGTNSSTPPAATSSPSVSSTCATCRLVTAWAMAWAARTPSRRANHSPSTEPASRTSSVQPTPIADPSATSATISTTRYSRTNGIPK